MFIDRVGQKFGRLTVIARASGRSPDNYAIWICNCDCGNHGYVISSKHIKTAKGCGCLIGNPSPFRGKTLTQARLKELLSYNPETGDFFWRVSKGKAKAGDRAGRMDCYGYWQISVDSKVYKGHRLAWLYVCGYFPKMLDHKDRNRSNNQITNLREATQSQNNVNSKGKRNSRSSLKGAWPTLSGRWQAGIQHNNKHFHLGIFDTATAAHAAYCRAARELYGDFFYDGGISS